MLQLLCAVRRVCAICMELVYQPVSLGCCTLKNCKSCLEEWRGQGKDSCPGCRARFKSGPFVVDTAYTQLLEKLCPNTSAQRRAALNPASQGQARVCQCGLPAKKQRPAQKSSNPDNVVRLPFFLVLLPRANQLPET